MMAGICGHIEQVQCPNCEPPFWQTHPWTAPPYTNHPTTMPPFPQMDTVEEAAGKDAELMDLRLRLQAVEHDLEHVVGERDVAEKALERAEEERDRAVEEELRTEAVLLETCDEMIHLEALLEDARRDRDAAIAEVHDVLALNGRLLATIPPLETRSELWRQR